MQPAPGAEKHATGARRGKNALVPSVGKHATGAKRGKTCNWCQVREKMHWCQAQENMQVGKTRVGQVMICYGFAPDWLKNRAFSVIGQSTSICFKQCTNTFVRFEAPNIYPLFLLFTERSNAFALRRAK